MHKDNPYPEASLHTTYDHGFYIPSVIVTQAASKAYQRHLPHFIVLKYGSYTIEPIHNVTVETSNNDYIYIMEPKTLYNPPKLVSRLGRIHVATFHNILDEIVGRLNETRGNDPLPPPRFTDDMTPDMYYQYLDDLYSHATDENTRIWIVDTMHQYLIRATADREVIVTVKIQLSLPPDEITEENIRDILRGDIDRGEYTHDHKVLDYDVI